MAQLIEAKPHYHFVTKLLIGLFNSGELPNVSRVIVEPTYGYVGRIEYHNGLVHMFRGTNLGVNSVGASELSKDKEYTKFFLRQLGYCTPEGEIFLMPDYQERISRSLSRRGFDGAQRSVDQAPAYVESTFGYPCYAKPNFGSQGKGVTRCESPSDLEAAISEFQKQGLNMILLERAVSMPDFRVVVFGDEVISCYQRIPLQVVGNGTSTIESLLQQKQNSYFEQGREEIVNIQDQRMLARLSRHGLTIQSVLASGQNFQLLDVSNLSTGGESEEFTHKIHETWKRLSIAITKDMGLRLCGVDIACTNLEDPHSDYSILEINAAPGLDNYASSGKEQFDRVRNLYKKIFNDLGQKIGQ